MSRYPLRHARPATRSPFSCPELRSRRLSVLRRHHVQTSLARQAYNLDNVRASSSVDRDGRPPFETRTRVTIVYLSYWDSVYCSMESLWRESRSNGAGRAQEFEFRTSIWKSVLDTSNDALCASSGPCGALTVVASIVTQFNSCSLSPSGNHAQIWRLLPNRASHRAGIYRVMPPIPKTARPVWSLESTSLSQNSPLCLRHDLTPVPCSKAPIKLPHSRSVMI